MRIRWIFLFVLSILCTYCFYATSNGSDQKTTEIVSELDITDTLQTVIDARTLKRKSHDTLKHILVKANACLALDKKLLAEEVVTYNQVLFGNDTIHLIKFEVDSISSQDGPIVDLIFDAANGRYILLSSVYEEDLSIKKDRRTAKSYLEHYSSPEGSIRYLLIKEGSLNLLFSDRILEHEEALEDPINFDKLSYRKSAAPGEFVEQNFQRVEWKKCFHESPND